MITYKYYQVGMVLFFAPESKVGCSFIFHLKKKIPSQLLRRRTTEKVLEWCFLEPLQQLASQLWGSAGEKHDRQAGLFLVILYFKCILFLKNVYICCWWLPDRNRETCAVLYEVCVCVYWVWKPRTKQHLINDLAAGWLSRVFRCRRRRKRAPKESAKKLEKIVTGKNIYLLSNKSADSIEDV